MKRLTDTRFFLLLKGNASNLSALAREYDNFSALLFEGGAAPAVRTAYRNTLAYTRVELNSLSEVSGKKCSSLSPQGY